MLDFLAGVGAVRARINWAASLPICANSTGSSAAPTAPASSSCAYRGSASRARSHTARSTAALQVLSLRDNNLTGAFPDELLAQLHLQLKAFSGAVPRGLAQLCALQDLIEAQLPGGQMEEH
jgi:hypothetical protein